MMQENEGSITVRTFEGTRKAFDARLQIEEWTQLQLQEKREEVRGLSEAYDQVVADWSREFNLLDKELTRLEKRCEVWKSAAVTFLLMFLALVIYTFGIQ